MLGLALAELGRCDDALPTLDGIAEGGARHGQATTSCLFILARREVEARRCRAALPLLLRLDGRLQGLEAGWRAEKQVWCQERVTEFVTDTAERKQAHQHLLAAREAAREGDSRGAVRLYQEALALADEPVIRHELARAQIDVEPCSAVLATLRPLDPAAWAVEDGAMIAACTRYEPPKRLQPAARATWLRTVVSILLARDTGAAGEAIALFDELPAAPGRALDALRVDLLFEAERCAEYLQAVEALSEARRLALVDAGPRALACERKVAEAGPAAPTPDGPAASPGEPPEAAEPEPEPEPEPAAESLDPTQVSYLEGGAQSTSGWVVLGGGVALMGVSAYFVASYLHTAADVDAAASIWAEGTASEAVVARRTYAYHQDRAVVQSALAISTGIAGVAAVSAGIVLLVLDGGEDDDGEAAHLLPTAGPGQVGLRGRF